jgi:hypothetical protein
MPRNFAKNCPSRIPSQTLTIYVLAPYYILDRNISAKTYISKIMRAADARFTETLAAAKKGLINSTFKRK